MSSTNPRPWLGKTGSNRPIGEVARTALADMIRPVQTGPKDALGWTEHNCVLYGKQYIVPNFYREIYSSTAPRLFVQKSAQTFASQYLIYMALWCCATGQGQRGNSLYIFPAERQLGDFCRGRLDPAIAASPKVKAILGGVDNTYQKAIASSFLYLRGAQTDKNLISVDADLALLDEVARYPSDVLALVDKRLGSSYLNWMRAVSTPVYPSDPAGLLWERSTKRFYHVRCSHCSTYQSLEVDENLNPETGIVECSHCRGDMTTDRLDLNNTGHWDAANPQGDWEGYQTNKLLSFRVDLLRLADTYRAVLAGDISQSGLQEFYNQDVGRPYLPEGGHVDPERLDACCTDPSFTDLPSTGRNCVMGIDVGKVLHVTINEPRSSEDGPPLLYKVYVGSHHDFSELDGLFHRYDVRRCVIDAAPETRSARAFADAPGHRGRVWLATYVERQDSNHAQMCQWDDSDYTVRVNRTLVLDSVIHNVDSQRLVLPSPTAKARDLGGRPSRTGDGAYYRHMCSPIRVLAVDERTREMIARYDQNGSDHYAHAEAYALAAADQAIGTVGVPPAPAPRRKTLAEMEDPLDPDNSPIDAFFLQDSHYSQLQQTGHYGRRSTQEGSTPNRPPYAGGAQPLPSGEAPPLGINRGNNHGRPSPNGFYTGTGRRIPATPSEWLNALDFSTYDDQDGPTANDTDGLPALDFSHAFAEDRR